MADDGTGGQTATERDRSGPQPATFQDLIRWLALPLDGQEPIFASMGVSGEHLNGDELLSLFREVMGDGRPAAPGEWQQCPSCLKWSVNSLT